MIELVIIPLSRTEAPFKSDHDHQELSKGHGLTAMAGASEGTKLFSPPLSYPRFWLDQIILGPFRNRFDGQ